MGEFVVANRGGGIKGLIGGRSNVKNGFAGIVGNFLLAENSHIFGEMKSNYLIADTKTATVKQKNGKANHLAPVGGEIFVTGFGLKRGGKKIGVFEDIRDRRT